MKPKLILMFTLNDVTVPDAQECVTAELHQLFENHRGPRGADPGGGGSEGHPLTPSGHHAVFPHLADLARLLPGRRDGVDPGRIAT